MITREFKLYLNAGVGVAPVINANQFDQDEEWIFTLLQSDGTVYTPSTGAIIGLKQDGTTILNAGTVNSAGQVVITETEQITAVPGSNLFEILIDGNTHGTANFVVFVERRPGDIDNPSETDISLFQEAITAAGNVTQFQADIAELKSDVDDLEEADTSLASQIAQEASTRSQQDAVLQAEIDQIIAPSGEAPSAAEVQNARIGVDGTTYDTLGNAIRGQVSDLKNALEYARLNNAFDGKLYAGYWNASGVLVGYVGDVCNNNKIPCPPNANIVLEAVSSISDLTYYMSYFDDNGRLLRDTGTGTKYKGVSPTGTKYFCFTFEKTGIAIGDISSVCVYINNLSEKVDNLDANITDIQTVLNEVDHASVMNYEIVDNERYGQDGIAYSANGWSRTNHIDASNIISIVSDLEIRLCVYSDILIYNDILTANTTYTIPDNASEIAFYSATSTMHSAKITSVINTIRGDLTEVEESTIGLKAIYADMVITGGYINGASGERTIASGSVYSNYIPLKITSEKKLVIHGLFNGYAGCAFYDKNYTFISGISGNNVSDYGGKSTSSLQTILVNLNNNARYIRLSGTSSSAVSDLYVLGVGLMGAFERIYNLEDNIYTVSEETAKEISSGYTGDVISLNPGIKSEIIQANYGNKMTMLHLSDIHLNLSSVVNLQHVISFYNKYDDIIDDIICTGDMVAQKFSDTYYTEQWDANGGGIILTCIGNHDCTEGGDEYGRVEHTQAEVYNKFIAPYVTGNEPLWGTVSYSENITYWYKDYTDKGTRVISMNALLSGEEANAQNVWLQNVLASAKENNYSVVILTHYGPYDGVKINSNFTDLDHPVISGFNPMYQQTVQSFIDDGGEFICYLSGHTHYDLMCYNSNYPSQLFVVVTNTNGEFPEDTKPKDRFNIVTFDKTLHIIKVIRVGGDRDKYMRHLGVITINYKTLEIIYSD